MDKRRIQPNSRTWAGFALVLDALPLTCVNSLAQKENAGLWLKEGHELRDNGHYEEALAAYDKAIELDSNCAGAWLGRGDALKALFKNCSELSAPPEAFGYDLYYTDYWSRRRNTLSALRRVEEASKAYDMAFQLCDAQLQEEPEDAETWINEGQALINLAYTIDFLEGDESSRELRREALSAYDRAIELDPYSTRAWTFKGMALNNELERLAAYEKAIELDPENAEAWIYRGEVLSNLADRTNNEGLYEEALDSYGRALNVDPDPRTWMEKGRLLIELGRCDEAMEAFDKAIELTDASETKKQAYFWREKALALGGIGRPKEAAQAYNETLRLYARHSEDPGAWTSRGYLLIRMGEYDESAEAFDEAVELIPADDIDKLTFFRLNRAVALEAMNRTQEAMEAYDEVIELNGEDPRGWLGRATILLNLGERVGALAAYDEVIELNPSQGHVFLSSAWCGKAHALRALAKYEQSLEAFDRVIELGPVPFFAWADKGDLLLEQCRYEEALWSYEKALELYPLEGAFWYKKGLALEAQGRGSKAQISFAMAKRLGYGGWAPIDPNDSGEDIR